MLFNSFDFLLFFLIVLVVYWSVPNKYKWIVLLLSSYFFYAYWIPLYTLILIAATVIDYLLNVYLISSPDRKRARNGLVISLVMNLSLLFSFKYFDFFNHLMADLLGLFQIHYDAPEFNIVLPLGISFYTFQIISYSVDVYRKTIEPEKNLGKFALYVCFFPQLIAGPIERAGHLLPQLNKMQFGLNADKVSRGLFLIFWGLFLKVVIADNIAPVVDHIYGTAAQQTGGGVLYGAILFTFQIYTDFSGYSCIALGTAALLDFELTANFHAPFYARSLSEFWQRWHITLSRWFRDYIYIPLGGNRGSLLKASGLIFLTMSISGLWHGASYNHLIWGCGHGVIMVIERLSGMYKSRLHPFFDYLRMLWVFVIVALLFIPFRAESTEQLMILMDKLLSLKWSDLYFWIADNRYKNYVFGILLLLIYDFVHRRKRSEAPVPATIAARSYSITFLILLIILLGTPGGEQFIYFQF